MTALPDDVDQGLFQHASGANYLHVLREILLTYRQLVKQLSLETGLSGAQFELMRGLALAGGRTTSAALARDLGVDPAAVTRLVAGLQKMGLVARESDADDGRRRPVVLTDQGRRLMLDLHARLHANEIALTEALDEQSVATAMQVLQTIRAALDPMTRGRR
jgi:DNA-binding MarR family transcriptional regulator